MKIDFKIRLFDIIILSIMIISFAMWSHNYMRIDQLESLIEINKSDIDRMEKNQFRVIGALEEILDRMEEQ
jgi:hypothetical protein